MADRGNNLKIIVSALKRLERISQSRRKNLMSVLTFDQQSTSDVCEHCGSAYPVSRGSVYADGTPFALYVAGMYGCEGDSIVVLTIAIARPVGDLPSAIALQVQLTATELQMSIIAPETSPWRNHTYLGRILTREEALSSPVKEVFFRIADLVVTTNSEVNAFLNS